MWFCGGERMCSAHWTRQTHFSGHSFAVWRPRTGLRGTAEYRLVCLSAPMCFAVFITFVLGAVVYTRWFKYDRDWLCVNKSQFVPVIFEPPCISGLGISCVVLRKRHFCEISAGRDVTARDANAAVVLQNQALVLKKTPQRWISQAWCVIRDSSCWKAVFSGCVFFISVWVTEESQTCLVRFQACKLSIRKRQKRLACGKWGPFSDLTVKLVRFRFPFAAVPSYVSYRINCVTQLLQSH